MSVFESSVISELETLLGAELDTLLGVFRDESKRLYASMQAAYANEDSAQMRLHAHSLKGAASNLGAMDIQQCCLQIEQLAPEAAWSEIEGLLVKLAGLHSVALEELAVRLAD